ncbi:2-C-methyl-D-erythritol 2,4-cyclodiphosphate synthase [Candidatus Bipolaricaulota bacterium]|nr:2-C-methyl-D-erythritol 2,4-cyclodiphosphate synthase [Candidatus Bipolaricaulota bacterium]
MGDGGIRVGIGVDFHRLVRGRRLFLGGVEIPFQLGLAGHSDADVLLHAICDALLGAAALGDIGRHFPPGDPAYKDISSLELLARVRELLAEGGYLPLQLDSVVIAEAPKLAPYIGEMRGRIAEALGLPVGAVSVKATTSEGLGPMGRGEGIAAWAVALIRKAA